MNSRSSAVSAEGLRHMSASPVNTTTPSTCRWELRRLRSTRQEPSPPKVSLINTILLSQSHPRFCVRWKKGIPESTSVFMSCRHLWLKKFLCIYCHLSSSPINVQFSYSASSNDNERTRIGEEENKVIYYLYGAISSTLNSASRR